MKSKAETDSIPDLQNGITPWGLPFLMQKNANSKIAWSNARLKFEGGDQALLDEFAWHVPIDKTQIESDAVVKTFHAERYGGSGIHNNGGGVRAAWTGNWIAKGVGINLLSGYSDDEAATFRHHGRARLSELMSEAVWGEVLHHALPYGAARVTAVLAPGERVLGTIAGVEIREFVWRPAHFMRASRFVPRVENLPLISSDTARVKYAISQLPKILPQTNSHPSPSIKAGKGKISSLDRLNLGLDEMVRRFAEQLAASKSKRLTHGALTMSNISIDGRWLDLASAGALPGFGERKEFQSFWDEHNSLIPCLEELCFYIGKYFPEASGEPASDMPKKDWLIGRYRRHYSNALARRFVGLCGYPQVVSDAIWSKSSGQSVMVELSDVILLIARKGHTPRRPYLYNLDDNHLDPNRNHFGWYHIGAILKKLSLADSAVSLAETIHPLISWVRIRDKLIAHYQDASKLMYAEARKQGVSKQAFARLVAINCNKSARMVRSLYREELYAKILKLVDSHPDVTELRSHLEPMINGILDEARVVYQEPRNFKTLLWCIGDQTIEFDARGNCLCLNVAGKKAEITFELVQAYLTELVSDAPTVTDQKKLANLKQLTPQMLELVSAMKSFWGIDLDEIMK
jgi:hypothetical protein